MVVLLSLLMSVGGIFCIMQAVQTVQHRLFSCTARTVTLLENLCSDPSARIPCIKHVLSLLLLVQNLLTSFGVLTVHTLYTVVHAPHSERVSILVYVDIAGGTLCCLCCLCCTFCPISLLTSYVCGQYRLRRPYCTLFISFRHPSVSRQRRTPVLSAVPHVRICVTSLSMQSVKDLHCTLCSSFYSSTAEMFCQNEGGRHLAV